MKRILIVEDDSAIRQGVADALQSHGFDTLEAGDAPSGLRKALEADYDFLLLDLVLPGGDGLNILREVRKSHPTLPVIILTARGAEKERIEGLRAGADDYVVKPFGIGELLARVDAVMRRTPERPADIRSVSLPGVRADLDARRVTYNDGANCELTPMECDLLRHLARNAGRPVSREEILLRVWGLNPGRMDTRAVDMHVARLRAKLRDDAQPPKIISTIRGKGYLFDGGGKSP